MKAFDKDILHELVDADENLSRKHKDIHKKEPKTINEAFGQMCEMSELYAEVIGCKRQNQVNNCLNEVCKTTKQFFPDLLSWKKRDWKKNNDETVYWCTVNDIKKKFLNQKNCYTSRGNDYVCFCDELG